MNRNEVALKIAFPFPEIFNEACWVNGDRGIYSLRGAVEKVNINFSAEYLAKIKEQTIDQNNGRINLLSKVSLPQFSYSVRCVSESEKEILTLVELFSSFVSTPLSRKSAVLVFKPNHIGNFLLHSAGVFSDYQMSQVAYKERQKYTSMISFKVLDYRMLNSF